MEDKPVKLKEKVYYARIHHNTVTYDVCDLVVQSIRDTYFAATDKRWQSGTVQLAKMGNNFSSSYNR